MKAAFLASAVGLAAVAMTTIAHAEQVRIGITAEPYPPFASRDASGKWVGWEIEIVDALCTEAKLDCVLTPVAWEGIIPALTSGKIDLIAASMSITDERKKVISFSDRYYKTPTMIVGAKGVVMTASAEGLKGKVVGVQVSTIHEDYVVKHFASALDDIKVYQTEDEAHQDLAAGRIDAVQADAIALEAFLASKAGRECCEAKGNVADDPEILGEGAGLGFRKEDNELREKFNAALARIRLNGTYQAISGRYFSFDIYGD